ncbi:MAG: 4Fe-4S ferredoxin [Proteobacteria bacterium]|nr:4Fe-4S ferredoxin [Pseudomonadota bacterium]
MSINSAKLVYFSPTRTTKQIVENIARGIQIEATDHLDLTLPEASTKEYEEITGELAIIGVPVYGGRVPLDAVGRLKRLKAGGIPAVLVVVYGNRAFEDALIELRDLAVEAGFTPVAGGAFIGEHSFASESVPIANGRPDPEDLEKSAEFGSMILKKMGDMGTLGEQPPLQVPGNVPYKDRRPSGPISPASQAELCTTCETCASVCPTGAITVTDSVSTDGDACILCCACIKNCPSQARVMAKPIQQMADWLSTNCSERKEPEFFV